jgi:hypothetical protein
MCWTTFCRSVLSGSYNRKPCKTNLQNPSARSATHTMTTNTLPKLGSAGQNPNEGQDHEGDTSQTHPTGLQTRWDRLSRQLNTTNFETAIPFTASFRQASGLRRRTSAGTAFRGSRTSAKPDSFVGAMQPTDPKGRSPVSPKSGRLVGCTNTEEGMRNMRHYNQPTITQEVKA